MHLLSSFMSIMPVPESRFVLLVSDIPGKAVTVDLTHTGDGDKCLVIDPQNGPFDAVQVAAAGDTIDDIFIFMHISPDSFEESGTESHAQEFLIDFCCFK